MKTLNTLAQDLKKIITSCGFWVCAGITMLLCFTAGIYRDSVANQDYTILGVFTSFNREWLLQDVNFSSINVFQRGGGSWLSMFIPIVSAFPFVPLFCDERHSGQIRYSISRTGKLRYSFSKLTSALIGGGFATAIGYAVFGIIVSILFPPLTEYTKEEIEAYVSWRIVNDSYSLSSLHSVLGNSVVVISSVLQMFLYGALSAMPAFVLSSFIRNKYLIMCFPFMFKYIYDQSMQKLMVSLWRKGDPNEKLEWFTQVFNSNSINGLFSMQDKLLPILMINFCIIAISLILFSIFMNRRRDLGA